MLLLVEKLAPWSSALGQFILAWLLGSCTVSQTGV